MAVKIYNVEIPYPDFKLNTIIDPEEFDQNNMYMQDKINEVIDKLQATLDGASGGDLIHITGIDGIAGGTTQEALESLKGYIDEVLDNIEEHKARQNNPHNVTAEQLGVYTKTELTPYLVSGDTEIRYDVYFIKYADNLDGTFTYTDGATDYIGELTPEGYQRFTLLNGQYKIGANRIEAFVNDTLHRSSVSGGLREVGDSGQDSYLIDLTIPAIEDTEITFKYYQRIGMAGRHALTHSPGGADELITVSSSPPDTTYAGMIWFEVM